MNRTLKFVFWTFLLGGVLTVLSTPVLTQSAKFSSIYSDLGDKKCKTLELDETGAGYYRGRCKGLGGFQLDVIEGDIRQTIDVIFPDGSKSELDLWRVVSGAFSSVGPRAEWRVQTVNGKSIPKALIVRFVATSEDPDSEKFRQINTSSLVVVKIEKTSACVTDIVPPTVRNQNAEARKLADSSASKPCKTENSN